MPRKMAERTLDLEQSRFLNRAYREFQRELRNYVGRRGAHRNALDDITQAVWERVSRSGYLICKQPPYCTEGKWADVQDPDLRGRVWATIIYQAKKEMSNYFRKVHYSTSNDESDPVEMVSLEHLAVRGCEIEDPSETPLEHRVKLELPPAGFSNSEISLIIAHFVQRRTIREIAEALGVSKSSIGRAIDQVESRLEVLLPGAGEEGDD